MASEAWKAVERTVAALLGGVRAWETDHDVLVIAGSRHERQYGHWPLDGCASDTTTESLSPEVLVHLHKQGEIRLASIEVKNLTAPTVAQLEHFLAVNQTKIDRDIPGATNALVIKRKAGPGRSTPYLLVMPLA